MYMYVHILSPVGTTSLCRLRRLRVRLAPRLGRPVKALDDRVDDKVNSQSVNVVHVAGVGVSQRGFHRLQKRVFDLLKHQNIMCA